ncbi:MAG: hypothetical protein WC373_01360 [Smithella sp.]|jgi:hypothetical protein
MIRNLIAKFILAVFILTIIACGGLHFSQLAPEAVNFHPKRIAVFPIEVWNHKAADSRAIVEQVVAGSLVEKKIFDNVTDVESLQKKISDNEELRNVKNEYFSKLQVLAFSDPDLSRKMGELAEIDAFLLVSVEEWKYTVEGDNKTAQVALNMELYDASTGKLMWKAGHSIISDYVLIKPELPKIARDVARKMIDQMPH